MAGLPPSTERSGPPGCTRLAGSQLAKSRSETRVLSEAKLMRRSSLLLPLMATASLVLAPSVEAKEQKHPTLSQKYSRLYYAVKHRHGTRAPGRNIRRHGVRYDAKANNRRGPWKVTTRRRSTRSPSRSANCEHCWHLPGRCSYAEQSRHHGHRQA